MSKIGPRTLSPAAHHKEAAQGTTQASHVGRTVYDHGDKI